MAVTILSVDDDEASRYLVGKILRGAGFNVVEAVTGTEALRLSLEHPDLILLDVNLPDMHGLEVCRRIKANLSTASIPVLHLTASSVDSPSTARGLQSGADGYLTQPIDPDVLIATIHALLRVKKAELQWEVTFEAISDPICLLDEDYKVLRSNRAFQALFNQQPRALRGEDIHRLLKCDGIEEVVLNDRSYQLSFHRITDKKADSQGFVLLMNDNTESKQNEEKIRISLKEKELLIQETHHRVKNNLQVITSLLVLQAAQVDDPKVKKMFEESDRRVRSMALIHELLYANLASATVDLTNYIKQLSRNLMDSYSLREEIDFRYDADSVSVDLDKILPLGLILNELISNALKYAFDPGQKGVITVSLKKLSPKQAELIIGDDGKGIANLHELGKSTSLGWKLIRMFVAQINATLEFSERPPGTSVRIVFHTLN